MTAGFRVGHVTRSARHIFRHRHWANSQTTSKLRANEKISLPANSSPRVAVHHWPLLPRAKSHRSRLIHGQQPRSRVFVGVRSGAPPCRTPVRLPDRPSSRVPSRGRALTSSRRCRWGARPGYRSRRPRACPPPLNRTTNLPRENRRARGAEGGRARPQRAPSTRRNARQKSPRALFPRFLISARSTLQLARADSPTFPFL